MRHLQAATVQRGAGATGGARFLAFAGVRLAAASFDRHARMKYSERPGLQADFEHRRQAGGDGGGGALGAWRVGGIEQWHRPAVGWQGTVSAPTRLVKAGAETHPPTGRHATLI